MLGSRTDTDSVRSSQMNDRLSLQSSCVLGAKARAVMMMSWVWKILPLESSNISSLLLLRARQPFQNRCYTSHELWITASEVEQAAEYRDLGLRLNPPSQIFESERKTFKRSLSKKKMSIAAVCCKDNRIEDAPLAYNQIKLTKFPILSQRQRQQQQ